MMMLVVDVTKGMQTQTAECLIIGEILCDKMIVVLNKIDVLEASKRDAAIEKVIQKSFETTQSFYLMLFNLNMTASEDRLRG